jgi:hypothetical protein
MGAKSHLTSNPRFESGSVHTAGDRNIIEEDIADISKLGLIRAQRSDTHSMSLISDGGLPEENIVSSILDGNGVIAIVNDAVSDYHVGTTDIKAVGIKGEATSGRIGVDDGIRDADVFPLHREAPCDGFQDLEVFHYAYQYQRMMSKRPVESTYHYLRQRSLNGACEPCRCHSADSNPTKPAHTI